MKQIIEWIAKNTEDKELLEKLSNDPDVEDYVAGNPNCSADLLMRLSQSTYCDVRVAVARNKSCPSKILKQLSNDPDWEVRYFVARNPNCLKKALKKLSRDPDKQVRYQANEVLYRD